MKSEAVAGNSGRAVKDKRCSPLPPQEKMYGKRPVPRRARTGSRIHGSTEETPHRAPITRRSPIHPRPQASPIIQESLAMGSRVTPIPAATAGPLRLPHEPCRNRSRSGHRKKREAASDASSHFPAPALPDTSCSPLYFPGSFFRNGAPKRRFSRRTWSRRAPPMSPNQ